MSDLTCDVLVVGAGPAGSAAAAALARAGHDVLLVESHAHPRPKACAEYASPRIAEELARLGLPDDAWQRDALPVRGMRVIRGDDAVEMTYHDAGGARPAWGLDRERFDAALAAYAVESGARLLERTALDDVHWRGYYIGLAPLAGGCLNVGMALPLNGDRRSAEDRFGAAIAGLPAVGERLRSSQRLTPIRGASPIAHRVRATAGRGWMLVGDAAGFIDPFTGEGIYRALRSARAAAEALVAGLDDGAAGRYRGARQEAFAAKDALTWTVQGMLVAPPLMGYALRRLARRPQLAARLGSALGDLRPASDAISPVFLAQVLRP